MSINNEAELTAVVLCCSYSC